MAQLPNPILLYSLPNFKITGCWQIRTPMLFDLPYFDNPDDYIGDYRVPHKMFRMSLNSAHNNIIELPTNLEELGYSPHDTNNNIFAFPILRKEDKPSLLEIPRMGYLFGFVRDSEFYFFESVNAQEHRRDPLEIIIQPFQGIETYFINAVRDDTRQIGIMHMVDNLYTIGWYYDNNIYYGEEDQMHLRKKWEKDIKRKANIDVDDDDDNDDSDDDDDDDNDVVPGEWGFDPLLF